MPSDMTIHWKALEEHFLMVPLVIRFNHLGNAFSEFFSENLKSLKSIRVILSPTLTDDSYSVKPCEINRQATLKNYHRGLQKYH
jgi:hypothetical protein